MAFVACSRGCVLQAYITAMVGSVEQLTFNGGSVEDPLDNDGALREQLERLPLIFRFQ